jgi:hypothetical protein
MPGPVSSPVQYPMAAKKKLTQVALLPADQWLADLHFAEICGD